MKLAFFSPFPPKRTGVADYSDALVRALRENVQVTAFDVDNPHRITSDADTIDFRRAPEATTRLRLWDESIFSIGNNPHHHLEILQVQQRVPGVVLLHDTVLYYLFAGLPRGSFYRHFCEVYGVERASEIDCIKRESPSGDMLQYRHPERYPFLSAVVRRAERVIVHSEFAARLVRSVVPSVPVNVIPHLALGKTDAGLEAHSAKLRKSLPGERRRLLIATFGFLGPSKRLSAICAALRQLAPDLDFHFLIVGDGPDPTAEFFAGGLAENITWLSYVPEADYDAWIGAADIVLNLRYPSMGECSGTLTRAMTLGRACVVTDYATFSELPDDSVCKIPFGAEEVSALVEAISMLARNADLRHRIGSAAVRHVTAVQAPTRVAAQFIDIVRTHLREKAHQLIINASVKEASTSRLPWRERILDGVVARMPQHLRTGGGTEIKRSQPRSLGLSEDEVSWAYRVLLCREPHAQEVRNAMMAFPTVAALRGAILSSGEFKSQISPAALVQSHPKT